jgi:Protein of unknown function (DUF2628)
MSFEGTQSGGFGRRGASAPPPASKSLPSSGGTGATQTNLVLAFIGENAECFKKTVEAMARKSDTLSLPVLGWCWPAFFFGHLWLVYRRMYAAAVGLVIIDAVVMNLFRSQIIAPLLMIACGLLGKSVYVILAARRVRSILEEERNPTAAVIAVRARGGTSWGAVWIALGLTFLFTVIAVVAVVGYFVSDPETAKQLMEHAKQR